MGKGPAEEWRAEQAVSGSAAPALPQADRRISGQLLAWLREPPGLLLPLSLPAPTVHTAIGSLLRASHGSHGTQGEPRPEGHTSDHVL